MLREKAYVMIVHDLRRLKDIQKDYRALASRMFAFDNMQSDFDKIRSKKIYVDEVGLMLSKFFGSGEILQKIVNISILVKIQE